jgi:hypothetical protein
MAFTALRPNTGKTRTGDKFIEEVYITYNNLVVGRSRKLFPSNDYNVGLQALLPMDKKSPDLYGGSTDPGSLFQITKSGETWSRPSLITPTINTPKSLESTASITPDGKTIYFASDRGNGQGGLDIYKTSMLANGSWGPPVNLGPEINTKANEDAPSSTLIKTHFYSDGHNTMGGRDIFVTRLLGAKWTILKTWDIR